MQSRVTEECDHLLEETSYVSGEVPEESSTQLIPSSDLFCGMDSAVISPVLLTELRTQGLTVDCRLLVSCSLPLSL